MMKGTAIVQHDLSVVYVCVCSKKIKHTHSKAFSDNISYSGKLLREKNFCGFVAILESFLRKIGGVASFGTAKASNQQEFSP